MSNNFSTPMPKTPSARYSLANIDAKDRQDVTSSCIDLEDAEQKTLGSRSRPMPSATIQNTKSQYTFTGKVPKGLDKIVATPRGDMELLHVWLTYKAEGTQEWRNVLIEQYLTLVRYTAERLHYKLPSEVDVDDLYSAGVFGLMHAINAYDLERGIKFETYCTQRVMGAIYDELRANDWVPRLVRSRTAKVERARKSIEMETGEKATNDEIIKLMEVDENEFEKLDRDSRPIMMTSLNRKAYDSDSSREVTEIDVISDDRQENPVHELQKKDLQLLLTKGLSRAEHLIVVLYYYEEMTMKEIGATLDLSESRVSQMHSSILARLKAQMQHRCKEF
jgi:RNA polymerase sigma factor for flagellar operon FliA